MIIWNNARGISDVALQISKGELIDYFFITVPIYSYSQPPTGNTFKATPP